MIEVSCKKEKEHLRAASLRANNLKKEKIL